MCPTLGIARGSVGQECAAVASLYLHYHPVQVRAVEREPTKVETQVPLGYSYW